MFRVQSPFLGAAARLRVPRMTREDQAAEALRHGIATIDAVLEMYGVPWRAEAALKALRDHHEAALQALTAQPAGDRQPTAQLT